MPSHSGPMACPVDGAALVMSERSGIEIDYCPTCRGVWLDRGELDKIIERNAAAMAPVAAEQSDPLNRQPRHHRGHRDRDYGERPRKRRGSFLEDLFD